LDHGAGCAGSGRVRSAGFCLRSLIRNLWPRGDITRSDAIEAKGEAIFRHACKPFLLHIVFTICTVLA
ncbi:MAG TPA: hypothetical protein VM715_20405, partial [Candidatus Acidoferrum sp.]|nr:hypothetical protein [Candidatus Acidoferrum sp.]